MLLPHIFIVNIFISLDTITHLIEIHNEFIFNTFFINVVTIIYYFVCVICLVHNEG